VERPRRVAAFSDVERRAVRPSQGVDVEADLGRGQHASHLAAGCEADAMLRLDAGRLRSHAACVSELWPDRKLGNSGACRQFGRSHQSSRFQTLDMNERTLDGLWAPIGRIVPTSRQRNAPTTSPQLDAIQPDRDRFRPCAASTRAAGWARPCIQVVVETVMPTSCSPQPANRKADGECGSVRSVLRPARCPC
jgi:hypothetical protein